MLKRVSGFTLSFGPHLRFPVTDTELTAMKKTVSGPATLLPIILFLSGCSDFRSPTEVLPERLEAARDRAMALCSGCHGPAGIGTASYNPNLACQKKEYMVKQLNYYRDGSRTTHQPMSNVARLLSEDEIENISEWYSITGCQ